MNYGRYQIIAEVGKGAMGVVYQARDPQIGRLVALKVLRQERVTTEEFVQRFLKEAKAIGQLTHPGIVTVYDVGRDHGTIYIAMEFLEGRSLDKVIQQATGGHKLKPEEIVDIGVQVAKALDYAHRKKIVHRDIKPSNIILAADGQAKLTDFGIARFEDPSAISETQAGVILGTPLYMSPEQAQGQPVDGRADLFSLGVILYELTAGIRPFKGENLSTILRATIQHTPAEPAKIDPSVSRPLSDLIMKSLNKKPEERFQTGKAMAEALQTCLEISEATAPLKLPVGKKSKYLVLWGLVALIILSAAAGFLYYTKGNLLGESRESLKPPPAETVSMNALLKVDSTPPGAQIFLDGTFKGKTPVKLQLPLGKHEIRLSLPDYYEWEAQLQLDKEGETPLYVQLIPMEEKNP